MNKDTVKGAAQKHAGEAQEGVGKALKDDKMIAKGVGNRAAGATKEAYGKVKDAAHKATH